MKRFTNLPSNLRALFGFLRGLTIIGGSLVIAGMVLDLAILPRFGAGGSIGMMMGEVTLRADPAAIELRVPGTSVGALALKTVRASLHARPDGEDAGVRAIILQCTVPHLLVTLVTAYLLFTALRRLCANWEGGDVFSDENLQLVRRIGLTLIVSSLVSAALAIWSSIVVGTFLRSHVSIGGNLKVLEFGGTAHFAPPAGILPVAHGLVIGCLVLMLTAAFRQGMRLKNENDLTV